MKVREIMTPEPEMVRAKDSVQKAAEMMKRINVGIVPVLDGDHAIGIITDRDIAVRVVAEGKDPRNTEVGQVMSPEVVACAEDADLEEAVKTMKEKQIRRLLVKDKQGRISGVVSSGDLAVAADRKLAGEVIREISKPAEPAR